MTLLREFGGFAGRSVSRKSITRCSDEACVQCNLQLGPKNSRQVTGALGISS